MSTDTKRYCQQKTTCHKNTLLWMGMKNKHVKQDRGKSKKNSTSNNN